MDVHLMYKILLVLFCLEDTLSFTRPRDDMFDDEPSLEDIYDPEHGVKMGIPQSQCDDGINGIERDWDPNSDEEYSCYWDDYINFHQKSKDIVDNRKNIMVTHICMNESIIYEDDLPLSGNHRPLWPQYGDYLYLPPQRWVHSLEHGAIVLLYHPCMMDSPQLVALKSIVQGCLGKHVISPYRYIPSFMPFALLAYQKAKLISEFDPLSKNDIIMVVNFIKNNALNAPESDVNEDGQYYIGIMTNATEYSDLNTEKKDVCAYL